MHILVCQLEPDVLLEMRSRILMRLTPASADHIETDPSTYLDSKSIKDQKIMDKLNRVTANGPFYHSPNLEEPLEYPLSQANASHHEDARLFAECDTSSFTSGTTLQSSITQASQAHRPASDLPNLALTSHLQHDSNPLTDLSPTADSEFLSMAGLKDFLCMSENEPNGPGNSQFDTYHEGHKPFLQECYGFSEMSSSQASASWHTPPAPPPFSLNDVEPNEVYGPHFLDQAQMYDEMKGTLLHDSTQGSTGSLFRGEQVDSDQYTTIFEDDYFNLTTSAPAMPTQFDHILDEDWVVLPDAQPTTTTNADNSSWDFVTPQANFERQSHGPANRRVTTPPEQNGLLNLNGLSSIKNRSTSSIPILPKAEHSSTSQFGSPQAVGNLRHDQFPDIRYPRQGTTTTSQQTRSRTASSQQDQPAKTTRKPSQLPPRRRALEPEERKEVALKRRLGLVCDYHKRAKTKCDCHTAALLLAQAQGEALGACSPKCGIL
ncbi:uncharacterized protein KY384_005713 [Bacidia gigantensis]|uniref:uncharacterized protein n=1 Tax=Bacidia gigantensis TaxID=2732470 RepID=UPI001D05C186|nr:uncharacterized protein KY384_005713 [Bacidia gigantensis]KAG8529078.1 hypothetical protein KY384_005713 [Bacidia gigantensis]